MLVSGETESDPSGWTPDLLSRYLGEKIDRDRQTSKERFAFICVVVGLGWNEIQRRLVTLNHAHEQQKDTLDASVTSDKYESDKLAQNARISGIESKLIASETRERSTADEASRQAGARAEQKSDTAGGRTAQRQTVAIALSALAITVTIFLAVYATRHRTSPGTTTVTQTVTTPAPGTP